jgi:hypothetical protein
MTKLNATFDGEVFRPEEPVSLSPNTQVRITVELATPNSGRKKKSFLDTARSLKLQGPPDWSSRFEEYLYGDVDGEAKTRE